MNATLMVGLFVCFCITRSEQSTTFLRTILTTPPTTSHISNFRNQPRSDSRADKPDTFPGFDFQDDDVTPSPIHRRRQAYSHLLRSFIQKTRERLETIREVAKQERAQSQVKSLEQAVAVDAMDSARQSGSAELLNSVADDEYDDDDDDEFLAEVSQPAVFKLRDNVAGTDLSVPRQYYATLLSSVGLQRTQPPADARSERLQSETEPSFITTYIANPLLNVWQRARDNFNLTYYRNGNSDGEATAAATNSDNASDLNGTIGATDETAATATQALKAGENNAEEIAFNSAANINDGRNGSAASLIVVGSANRANHLLPFKLNVNSERRTQAKGSIEENASATGGTSQGGSHWERAALAFQNAFYKYAGQGAMPGKQSDSSDVNDSAADDNDDDGVPVDDGGTSLALPASAAAVAALHEDVAAVDMQLAQAVPLTDARSSTMPDELQENKNSTKLNGIPAAHGNVTLTTTKASTAPKMVSTAAAPTVSPNIQIIPSHLVMQRQQQQQQEQVNAGNGGLHPAESAGIFVLEIVGTVVGLTWGAFSQLQNWLGKK